MKKEFLLYLVRHGESANNALPDEQRVEDPALTALGEIQAQKLGERFKNHVDIGKPLDLMLSSPFLRTIQTSRPTAKQLAMKPTIWTDLYEVGGCFSGYQEIGLKGCPGMTREQLQSKFPEYQLPADIDHNGWYKFDSYETHDVAVARAERQAARLKKEFLNRNITVMCTIHADFKNLLLEQFLPSDPIYSSTLCYNTSVTLLRFRTEQPEVLMFNDVSHLAADEISPA